MNSEEYGTLLAETNPKIGEFERVVACIRQQLHKITSELKMTDSDIIYTLQKARKQIVKPTKSDGQPLYKQNRGTDSEGRFKRSDRGREDAALDNGSTSKYVIQGDTGKHGDATVAKCRIPASEAAVILKNNPTFKFEESFVETSDYKAFHTAISESKKENKYAPSVHEYLESLPHMIFNAIIDGERIHDHFDTVFTAEGS